MVYNSIFFQNLVLFLTSISLVQSELVYQLNNSTVVGSTNCPGYKLSSLRKTSNGFSGKLEQIGSSCNLYSSDITNLMLKVRYDNHRLRVQILDRGNRQFQVFEDIFSNRVQPTNNNSKLKFEVQTYPFSFRIRRKWDNSILFDTLGHQLTFSKNYLELSSSLNSNSLLYGLGESVDTFYKPRNGTKVVTLWARDVASPQLENLYGTFPFYIQQLNNQFLGVHLLNSYGMDIVLKPDSISYKVLGGVLDFSFFAGEGFQEVVGQYTATFGRPHPINFWSLGFHQCRWGMQSLVEVEEVVDLYLKNAIPLETIWIDIDYMDQFKDFTFDPNHFPLQKLQKFIAKIHSLNMRIVLILDPAISNTVGYYPYDLGSKLDIFLKGKDGKEYIGQVWPGYTVFPDWFHPRIQLYWTTLLKQFLDQVDVDGIWLDMNEPASFCLGSCGSGRPPIQVTDQEEVQGVPLPQTFAEPNYAIHNYYGNLSLKTVSTDAIHHNNWTQLELHNLYGHKEAQITNLALKQLRPNLRPFLMSRSTTVGSGAYTGHWTGDNLSRWEHLKLSISMMFGFHLFGIPYVGADICGFKWDTTEELCLRWMQLGSLYLFSRNHNNKWSLAQEPYRWESVKKASIQALRIRYQLIYYLYTLMESSSRLGRMVWIPLSFQFPNQGFDREEEQFMVGEALLVAPVLQLGSRDLHLCLPKGRWYHYHTYQEFLGNSSIQVEARLDQPMPMFVRGGHILPVKHFTASIQTLHQLDPHPFTLILGLDSNLQAQGSLYQDDGVSLDLQGRLDQIKFQVHQLALKVEGTFHSKKSRVVDKIIFLGLPAHLKLKALNRKPQFVQSQVEVQNGYLQISNLQWDLSKNQTLQF